MAINIRELIVAADPHGNIGSKGRLGFYLPQDMEWFRWYTMGKTVVAGAVTAKSFGWDPEHDPQPLPGRNLLVLSKEGITGTTTLDAVLAMDESVCFIGGGKIYEQVKHVIHRAVVTHLDQRIQNADTKFDLGWLNKRFDKFTIVKRLPEARIVIYENIRR